MDTQAVRALVAANIRRLADERDLPLSKLADFAGIARPAFWRALGGESAFTTDRLAKIAGVLEVGVASLLEAQPTAANPKSK